MNGSPVRSAAEAGAGSLREFVYVCGDPGIPLPGSKGASLHVESVCREFRRRGLQGSVHCVRPELSRLEDYPVVAIGIPPRRRRKSREERENRLFLASYETTLRFQKAPDFVYERYSLWHVGGLAAARHWGVPFVLEVNSPLPDEEARHRSLANADLARGIARVLCRESDLVVCVSAEIAAWVAEQRDSSEGVLVVPNGVDPEIFDPGDRQRPLDLPPPSVPLIAFSGSFRPWHGLGDLLDAFEILVRDRGSEAHLLCVGDGPLRASFAEDVAGRGLDSRVHLPGQLPQKQVARWIAGADLAVAPYPLQQDFYFSPLKLYEFMVLGLPVVASDVGQIRQVLSEGFGALSPPGDAKAMAEAMGRLLGADDRSRSLGEAARRWVLAEGTWDARVAQILSAVEALRCGS